MNMSGWYKVNWSQKTITYQVLYTLLTVIDQMSTVKWMSLCVGLIRGVFTWRQKQLISKRQFRNEAQFVFDK